MTRGRDLRAKPGKLHYQVAGHEELTELARVGVQDDTPAVLSMIKGVQNALLRADLLIAAANGILDSRNSAN
ncbi:MAG: hypothetical protein JWQ87_5269 [Candidatus Sulfotelmatobacter sp.]|nr:hypothetical protein [Candidatus Sulfotelmatobacter sp.]